MLSTSRNNILRKLRVLIVDDVDLFRELIHGILLNVGISDIEALGCPEKALGLLSRNPFDVVFADWEMPSMSGLDFVRAIRKINGPSAYAAIIMVTSHAEMARVVEARDAGINEYVIKPITGREILSKLQSVINNPRTFIRTETYFGPAPREASASNPGEPPLQPADTAQSSSSTVFLD
jgi:two-component system, chemotaxis family, chemotaxis protein CheY